MPAQKLLLAEWIMPLPRKEIFRLFFSLSACFQSESERMKMAGAIRFLMHQPF